MKTILRLSALIFVAAMLLPMLYGFTINGGAPGSSASMTPVTCPTGAATRAAPCATPSAGAVGRSAIEFSNIGTANAYIAVAPNSSPCSAASPVPNASTKAGEWIPPNSKWTFVYDKTQDFGGRPQIQGQWDASCDGTGSSIGYTELP